MPNPRMISPALPGYQDRTTLAYAGCRISEALALTADPADLAAGVLVIESLKKRRTGAYRNVPVLPALLDTLGHGAWHNETQTRRGVWLWLWSRMTGWRPAHMEMESLPRFTSGFPNCLFKLLQPAPRS